MIQRFRLGYLVLTLFLFGTIISAWPWPPSYKDLEGLIIRRADSSSSQTDSTSTSAATAKASATAKETSKSTAKETAKASKTASPASRTGKASKTAAATTGAKASASASGTQNAAKTTSSAAVTSVNDVLPPGGVNLITPSAAETTYYKIGDYVTFAWNYTSLSITPSKIDVVVSCSANSATYTLQNNETFAKTGSVVWDTAPEETGTAPLLTDTYTLVIYDAAEAVTAVAGAGRLGASNNYQFGMYIPQNYTPANEWTCAVCSGAFSATERQSLGFMFIMCAATIFSFTWFAGGFSGLI